VSNKKPNLRVVGEETDPEISSTSTELSESEKLFETLKHIQRDKGELVAVSGVFYFRDAQGEETMICLSTQDVPHTSFSFDLAKEHLRELGASLPSFGRYRVPEEEEEDDKES
jgi:uncharacterized protein YcfL